MKTNFFADLIVRLLSGKPQFFTTIQRVAAALAIISFAIDKLNTSGVILPGWVATVGSSVVWISSIVAAVIAQLPVKDFKQIK